MGALGGRLPLSDWQALCLAFFSSFCAPFGGILASAAKRAVEMKDFGQRYVELCSLFICGRGHARRGVVLEWQTTRVVPPCSSRTNLRPPYNHQPHDSIPGHGGIMDRVDCQLFQSAFAFQYLAASAASVAARTAAAAAAAAAGGGGGAGK